MLFVTSLHVERVVLIDETSDDEENENNCFLCKQSINEEGDDVKCGSCNCVVHKNCIFDPRDNETGLFTCDSCSSTNGSATCRVCSGSQFQSPDYLHQSQSGNDFFHLKCITKTRPKPEVTNETYIYKPKVYKCDKKCGKIYTPEKKHTNTTTCYNCTQKKLIYFECQCKTKKKICMDCLLGKQVNSNESKHEVVLKKIRFNVATIAPVKFQNYERIVPLFDIRFKRDKNGNKVYCQTKSGKIIITNNGDHLFQPNFIFLYVTLSLKRLVQASFA